MNDDFQQYALQHEDGADIYVDVVEDAVLVRQNSMGVTGRGPMKLTSNEAHELARQIEAAASAAARYKPPEPETAAALPSNTSPDVDVHLRALGIDRATLDAIKSFQEERRAATASQAPQEAAR